MDIKQVIVVVRAPKGAQRVVYGSDGDVVAGNEEAAQELAGPDAALTVSVRGTKGESVKTTVDGKGKCVSGDVAAVVEALEGFPNDAIADILRGSIAVSEASGEFDTSDINSASAGDPGNDAGDNVVADNNDAKTQPITLPASSSSTSSSRSGDSSSGS